MGDVASVSGPGRLCAGDGGLPRLPEGEAAGVYHSSDRSGDAHREQQRHHARSEQPVSGGSVYALDFLAAPFPEPEACLCISCRRAGDGRVRDDGGTGNGLSRFIFFRRRDLWGKKGCKSGKQCYTDRYEDPGDKRGKSVGTDGLCERAVFCGNASCYLWKRARTSFHPGYAPGHLSLLAGSGYLSCSTAGGGAERTFRLRGRAPRGDRL